MKIKILFYYVMAGIVLSTVLYFLDDSYIEKQEKIKTYAIFSLFYPLMIIIKFSLSIILFFKKR
jgi:hypothetical protein